MNIPEANGMPLLKESSFVVSKRKSLPRFLIARLEAGIGIRTALRITCDGNRFKQFKSASIINSSAILRELSFAFRRIDLAIGEYLMDE
jgi:hypothetical protein